MSVYNNKAKIKIKCVCRNPADPLETLSPPPTPKMLGGSEGSQIEIWSMVGLSHVKSYVLYYECSFAIEYKYSLNDCDRYFKLILLVLLDLW